MTQPPAGRADAYPHAADLALIPFAIGSDRGVAHFVLTPDLTRHDGADDPQMEEWRRSITRADADGGTRD